MLHRVIQFQYAFNEYIQTIAQTATKKISESYSFTFKSDLIS
jgi:hypothetical protein